ncbi:MAG: hypothetical protein KDI71_17960 [Xanthomonadales bacterium]|nr:hypothetical protein [Xanthomonadales bacterium]
MSIAEVSTFQPQRYEVRGPAGANRWVWLEEHTINGGRSLYGPYAVGTILGERDLAPAIDWAAISTEQRNFRRLQASAIVATARGNDLQAELRLSESGWHTVTFEQLLESGIDFGGQQTRHLRLTRDGADVPLSWSGDGVFGPGMSFSFLGKAVENSLYTKTAVYQLASIGTAVTPLQAIYAGVGGLALTESAQDEFVHAPNRSYSFSSPLNDPWAARRVLRNNVPLASGAETFVLPQKAGLGVDPESIEVLLWGGIDHQTTPDHSVRLLLNGQVLGSFTFDGLDSYTYTTRLPPNLLQSGSNSLTIELIGDTQSPVDVVYLESIKVKYSRALLAQDDRIDFNPGAVLNQPASSRLFADGFDQPGVAACTAGPSCAAYRIGGFSQSDLQVVRERNGTTQQLGSVQIDGEPGNYRVSFAVQSQAGDRIWVAPQIGAATTARPAIEAVNPLAGGPAEMLIVSHPSFIDGLAPLVSARQAEGLTVKVVDVEQVYRNYSFGVVDPVAIDQFIADAERSLGTRYVLLVGGDTYDYFNAGNSNSISFVPTFYRQTNPVIRFAPVDSVYADTNNDGLANVAVGRWPVRTSTELTRVINKTLAYPTAGHQGSGLLVSDRNSGGVDFADYLNQLGNNLASDWSIARTRLNDYAPGTANVARAEIAAQINAGQALVSFLGHSSPSTWSQESLLTANQVYGGLLSNGSSPTVLWQLGCYGSYFVMPNYSTLAHALLLTDTGAAAVLGASGLTTLASDLQWMNTLSPMIDGQRIGDAMIQAQREMAHKGEQYVDITMGGMLLGDPTLRIH